MVLLLCVLSYVLWSFLIRLLSYMLEWSYSLPLDLCYGLLVLYLLLQFMVVLLSVCIYPLQLSYYVSLLDQIESLDILGILCLSVCLCV